MTTTKPTDPTVAPTTAADVSFAERINRNIKAELARADKSKRQVAYFLDLSPDSVQRRFSGKLPWSVQEIELIATLLHVDPSDLTA